MRWLSICVLLICCSAPSETIFAQALESVTQSDQPDSLDQAPPAQQPEAKKEKAPEHLSTGWSSLFKDSAVDAKKLIREKTVLDDLENAIDACDSIADTLTNLAIKHG